MPLEELKKGDVVTVTFTVVATDETASRNVILENKIEGGKTTRVHIDASQVTKVEG